MDMISDHLLCNGRPTGIIPEILQLFNFHLPLLQLQYRSFLDICTFIYPWTTSHVLVIFKSRNVDSEIEQICCHNLPGE